MAKPFVDISMVGDKALQAKLNNLGGAGGRKVVRGGLRKSSKRIQKATIGKISSGFFDEPTGNLLQAFKATKVRAGKRSRSTISIVWPRPTQEQLGRSASDRWYYPWAVEYGAKYKDGRVLPPKSYIRSTVNEREAEEFRLMGRDIGTGIEREFRKAKGKR